MSTADLIHNAVRSLASGQIKVAVVPVSGGQIPPPVGQVDPPGPPGAVPGDPGMAGAMPPGAMPPGGPGGPPPGPGGPPPGDPSMAGPPPGAGGPPPGAPMDAAMGPPPAGPMDGQVPDASESGVAPDPAVPLSAAGNFAVKLIEATKGKRTADPKDPNSMQDPAAAGGLPPETANIGGAPSEAPMALPGMGPPPKAAAAIRDVLDGIKKVRGW